MAKADANTKDAQSAEPESKGERTRALILETARKCLNKHGVNTVTCRTIAKAAGLAPGNIYYYFNNMEEILWTLNVEIGRQGEKSIREMAHEGFDDARARRKAAIRWLDIVWTWRYAFLDLSAIMRGDDRIRRGMQNGRQDSVELQATLLEKYLKSRGLKISTADRKLCRDLAAASWIVSMHWLHYVSLTRDIAAMSRPDFLDTVDDFVTIGTTLYDDKFILRLAAAIETSAEAT